MRLSNGTFSVFSNTKARFSGELLLCCRSTVDGALRLVIAGESGDSGRAI